MRQIALDTETTGLYPEKGDRIIEIAAVEILNRRVTKNAWHRYVNPERDVPADSVRIHGITTERLQNEPLFAALADDFLDFIDGAELIIHNAAFDVSFLNMELSRANKPTLESVTSKITDTVALAKKTLPGKGYSLDGLCDFYHIDRAARTQHGALIDTELLAQVYLALTRGQDSLFAFAEAASAPAKNDGQDAGEKVYKKTKIIRASETELAAHEATLAAIAKKSGSPALWQNL